MGTSGAVHDTGRGLAKPFTVGDGSAIAKNQLLRLVDPRTVSAASGTAVQEFAGIAADEKVASDGSLKLGAYRDGYWEIEAQTAIGVGDAVVMSGSYAVSGATSTCVIDGSKVGNAMEAAGSPGEVIVIEVNP